LAEESGSSLSDYQSAYDYVSQQDQKEFLILAIIECGNEDIQLRWPLENQKLNRNTVGIISVSIDLFITFTFLLALFFIQNGVKKDTETYRKQMYETKQFSVVVYNLPKVSMTYSIE
jgi:hypothetical protein